jgi:hypothetical protein
MSKKMPSSGKKSDSKFVSAKEWQRTVETICAELEWKTQTRTDEDKTLIICPLQGSAHFMGALFVISEDAQRLAIYLSYRIKTSSKKHKQLIEELNGINFGMLGGCLEFDSDSGEIRYRDSMLTAVEKIDLGLFQAFVASSLENALELYSVIKVFDETKRKSAKKQKER